MTVGAVKNIDAPYVLWLTLFNVGAPPKGVTATQPDHGDWNAEAPISARMRYEHVVVPVQ
jgi:hypothetical protein